VTTELLSRQWYFLKLFLPSQEGEKTHKIPVFSNQKNFLAFVLFLFLFIFRLSLRFIVRQFFLRTRIAFFSAFFFLTPALHIGCSECLTMTAGEPVAPAAVVDTGPPEKAADAANSLLRRPKRRNEGLSDSIFDPINAYLELNLFPSNLIRFKYCPYRFTVLSGTFF